MVLGAADFRRESPAKFRFTVEIWSINKHIILIPWPIPHLDLGGRSEDFSLVRLHSQVLATRSRRKLPLSFSTPDCVLTPTQVLHETMNGVSHIQERVQKIIGDLEDYMIVW